MRGRSGRRLARIAIASLCCAASSCRSSMPSSDVEWRSTLPIPAEGAAEPEADPEAAGPPPAPEPDTHRISARALVPLTFDLHPEIKSSYQRFKAEEARYDFFYVSRDSLTPSLRLMSEFERSGSRDAGRWIHDEQSDHSAELSLEKRFFDTTRIDFGSGLAGSIENGDGGYRPYAFAEMYYPLAGSRERLERTSEALFRRNELDDAQLEYIKKVRSLIQNALEQFYEVIELQKRLGAAERWQSDLETLLEEMGRVEDRDTAGDESRARAELAQAASTVRNMRGRYEIEVAGLKAASGLSLEDEIEIDEEPFNPFLGEVRAEILEVAIQTDPEIATLRNASANAKIQFDLARRGRWDIALRAGGQADIRGEGTAADDDSWAIFAGLEIGAVDRRVTASLERQAQANMRRFDQAIVARHRRIHVSALDSLIRIETLTASRDELIANLGRYEEDYRNGVQEYLAGTLNVDDLLDRRETLFQQEDQLAELTNWIGENVAELCSATGRFFEMLGSRSAEEPQERP